MAWNIARTIALGVILSAGTLVACGTGQSEASGSYSYGPEGFSSSSSSGSSSGGNASNQPMLVDVDPNRTMTATPGAGVGIFTQYETGGHWSIWWTCDTSKTGLPCAFDIKVSVTTGSLADAAGQSLADGDTLTQASAQELEVVTDTTTTLQGVTFDTVVPAQTTPVITLDAKLNGVDDPSYLFFVQDGAINGNYTGTLTDPLMLEPSSP